MHYNRITAQVAVEAIVNHPADGYDLDTMRAVLAVARTEAVAEGYVTELAELVARTEAGPCASDCGRAAGHGHFAAYCQPCSELPYWSVAP